MRDGRSTGRRGWRQWREDDARTALAEWEASGLSLEAFARRRGVSPTRLRNWRRRLRDADAVRFVAVASPAPTDASVEVVVRGVVVRTRGEIAPAQVAELVAVLAATLPPC